MKKFVLYFIVSVAQLPVFAQWYALPNIQMPPNPMGYINLTLDYIKPLANGRIFYSVSYYVGGHAYDHINSNSNDDLSSNTPMTFSPANLGNYNAMGINAYSERNKDTFAINVVLADNTTFPPSNFSSQTLFVENNFNQFTSFYSSSPNSIIDLSLTKNYVYAYFYSPFRCCKRNISTGIVTTYTLTGYNGPGKIQFMNDSVGYCLVKSFQNSAKFYLLKTIDFNTSLNAILIDSLTNISSFHFPTISTGYVLYSNGKLLKTTDGGNSWLPPLTVPALTTLNCIRFINDTVGYVGGDGGYIAKTTNGGANWLTEVTTCTNNISEIYTFDTVAYFKDNTKKLYKNSIPISTVGTKEYDSEKPNISVFPNPANTIATINFGNNFSGKIYLYNSMGQLIFSKIIDKKESIQLNMTDYLKGVYFLKAFEENKRESFVKIIRD